MTAHKKAVDLFNDYYSYLKANLMYDEEARQDAKQCALIAVDEILSEYQSMSDVESVLVINDEVTFVVHQLVNWNKVKQELEKL